MLKDRKNGEIIFLHNSVAAAAHTVARATRTGTVILSI